jgi:general secretion pathway protein K
MTQRATLPLSRRRRERKRGVALLLVLGALAVLTVMLTEFQDEASAEFGNATAERDALKAEYAARSAVNLGRLLIAAEPTMRKSLGFILAAAFGSAPQLPVWNYADQILGAFNDTDRQKAFAAMSGVELDKAKNLGLPGAAFDLLIVDEDSKINVNLPARGGYPAQRQLAQEFIGLIAAPQYDPMFEQRDADDNFSDRLAICSALVDWTDPDQDAFNCDLQNFTNAGAGAEDAYYSLLKPPYYRKNSAFDSLEELHLVRGISDEFWSTFVDPEPDDPKRRVLTVWSSGKVNINSANPQALLSLVCGNATPETNPCLNADTQFAESLLMMRGLMQSMVGDLPIMSPDQFIRFLTSPPAQAGASGAGGTGGTGGKTGGAGSYSLIASLMDSLMPNRKPIKFQAQDKVKEALTRESKVFSFYATGRVKSGKRETQVRIHAVVDYRNAPPPGQSRNLQNVATLFSGSGASPSTASTTTTSGTGGAGSALPAGATEDGYLSVLKPGPGGNVIYYRID